MSRSISRVTRMGARSPRTATAPSTRSAKESAFSMFGRVASMVVTGEGRWPAALRRWATLTSRRVTCAPRPSAARAAERPSTPAPRTTKFAGGTPGTPPRRMPLPPNSFSRRPLPSTTARLPAISDIDVRTGACPASSSMASMPTVVASRSVRARKSSGRVAGSAQKPNTTCSFWSCAYSCGAGA